MLKVIRWAVVNFTVLGMFLYGTIYNIEGLLNISVFLLWLVSIVGILGFMEETARSMVKKGEGLSVPGWVDVTFDIIVLGIILYFGYMWLSAFYLIHILGLVELRKNIKKLKDS